MASAKPLARRGFPEATYRRRLRRVGLQEHAAVAAAIDAAPVALSAAALLRISRHGTEAEMLAALEAEIGAQLAPRPPSAAERLQAENDRLRQRIAELEAEIGQLRPKPVHVVVRSPVEGRAEVIRGLRIHVLRVLLFREDGLTGPDAAAMADFSHLT